MPSKAQPPASALVMVPLSEDRPRSPRAPAPLQGLACWLVACKRHGLGHAPQGAAQGWQGRLWSRAALPLRPAPGAQPSLCAGRMDKDSWGSEYSWGNLSQPTATAKAQGEGALRPGLACHSTSQGYRLPVAWSRCSPGTARKQLTYCPLAHTCAAGLGWSRMRPRLLSQPWGAAALVRGAGFGAGWDGG